jgi:glycerophosphoryl diester phosphodiesterase
MRIENNWRKERKKKEFFFFFFFFFFTVCFSPFMIDFIFIQFFLFQTLLIFVCGGDIPKTEVIAEGGSSGVRPDESVLAYAGAYSDGASMIACDVQVTYDLVPVCAQSIDVSAMSNLLLYPEFTSRVMNLTDTLRNITYTNVFPFPLFNRTEIASLRIVRDANDPRGKAFDQLFVIVELEIFLQLIAALKDETLAQTNATDVFDTGVYIEAKTPQIYRDVFNITVEDVIMSKLRKTGWWPPRPGRRVLFQSFDPVAVKRFGELGGDDATPALVQMIEAATIPTLSLGIDVNDSSDATDIHWDLIFNRLASNVGGISIDKQLLTANMSLADHIVKEARDRSLFVHVWTFRAFDAFWNTTFPSFNQEVWFFLWLQVEGVFSDDPADVRREMLREPHTPDPPLPQDTIIEVVFIFSLIGAAGSCFAFFWVYWGTEKPDQLPE